MKKLSIAYFGTPVFSSCFLEKILTDTSIKHLIEVKIVVTQPDRPVGKRKILTASPVKQTAKKHGIEVFELENFNTESSKIKELKLKIKKVDFCLVFAYGFRSLIPSDILSAPKVKFAQTNSGFLNIHPSLLPKYRGASPIAYPLILGEEKTGVTIFVVDKKMDHGPLVAQEEMIINTRDKRPDLEQKLTDLAFELFSKIVRLILTDFNRIQPIPQKHKSATHARYLTREDGFIPVTTIKKALNGEPLNLKSNELPQIILQYITDYHLAENWQSKIKNSSKIVFDFFRGMYPWPGIWTMVEIKSQQKRLKINDLAINDHRLKILRVQLEGKKEVDFDTFRRAYPGLL